MASCVSGSFTGVGIDAFLEGMSRAVLKIAILDSMAEFIFDWFLQWHEGPPFFWGGAFLMDVSCIFDFSALCLLWAKPVFSGRLGWFCGPWGTRFVFKVDFGRYVSASLLDFVVGDRFA